jgi:hippurate hydrolase
MAAADGYRITVHGRGGHGSMPHLTVDPVLLAANIVVRLQGVVAREVPPGRTAVLTVGSLRAGIKENVIPDSAELKVCVRSYDENTRSTVIGALKRIVTGECAASGSPRTPEFEVTASFPVTENDAATTERVDRAFRAHFDHRRLITMRQLAGSEDFCRIPAAKGVPYIYWSFGGADPAKFPPGAQPDEFSPELPTNHSPGFAPVIEPTLSTGVQALLVAALAWLGE